LFYFYVKSIGEDGFIFHNKKHWKKLCQCILVVKFFVIPMYAKQNSIIDDYNYILDDYVDAHGNNVSTNMHCKHTKNMG